MTQHPFSLSSFCQSLGMHFSIILPQVIFSESIEKSIPCPSWHLTGFSAAELAEPTASNKAKVRQFVVFEPLSQTLFFICHKTTSHTFASATKHINASKGCVIIPIYCIRFTASRLQRQTSWKEIKELVGCSECRRISYYKRTCF